MKSLHFIVIYIVLFSLSACNQNAPDTAVEKEENKTETVTPEVKTDTPPLQEQAASEEERERLIQERKRELANTPEHKTNEEPTVSRRETTTPSQKSDNSKPSLRYVSKYTGQYPSTINFLGNTTIKTRIESLVGQSGYSQISRLWKEETPLVMEDSHTFTTGQQSSENGAPRAAIMIDITNDILFIALRTEQSGNTKIYAEGNAAVPSKLNDWASK
jgi:hypothetical protein